MAHQHSIQVRVYLEDTDAGGVVYHGSYLRFMERCRTEWLRALALEQSATFQQNVSFVVHSMSLKFQRPALLDDLLNVSCSLQRLSAASLEFEQEVRRTQDDALLCTALVRIACLDLVSRRARRLPEGLPASLKP